MKTIEKFLETRFARGSLLLLVMVVALTIGAWSFSCLGLR
jgi:hypothetical protein